MYFRRDFRQADNCLSLMSFFVCKMRTNLSTLWDFLSMRNKVSERHTMFLGEDDDSFKLLLFSCLVMPDSLWPHGLQHSRLSCPSLSPRVCLTSCPLDCFILIRELRIHHIIARTFEARALLSLCFVFSWPEVIPLRVMSFLAINPCQQEILYDRK